MEQQELINKNIENIKKNISDKIDKEIQVLENIYYNSKGNGYVDLFNYLKSDKNFLCDNQIYPESPYELSPEKIKEFINETLLPDIINYIYEDLRVKIKSEKIEKDSFYSLNTSTVKETESYNQALDDILQLLEIKEK